MNAALRKTSALAVKDFKDTIKNPATVVSVLIPVALMAVYRFVMFGEAEGHAYAEAQTFLLAVVSCMAVGMVCSMTIIYSVAEEKEKHTLRTLMLANVSAGQVLVAKALVSVVAVVVIAVICFFVAGADVAMLPAYGLINAFGAIPIVFLALVLGMFARDQSSSGAYAVPLLIVAMLPFVGMTNEMVERISIYTPCGGLFELNILLANGNLLTSDALVPVASTLVWTVIAIALFFVLYKKVGKDN